MSGRIRIGISVNFMHADPERALFKGKTLQFVEQKMILAVARAGAVPVLVPDMGDVPGVIAEQIDDLHGLLLSGGADVAPGSYGEEAIEGGRWPGDAIRDAYETRLIEAALAAGRPVLGICRGIQMVNVALGGTLYQDLQTQRPDSLVHRDWHRYEIIEHEVDIVPDSWVAGCYPDAPRLLVNTVHHQGLRELAPGLRVTAVAPDGVTEAVEDIGTRWIVGIQWHPEWLDGSEQGGTHRRTGEPVFKRFATVCRERAP